MNMEHGDLCQVLISFLWGLSQEKIPPGMYSEELGHMVVLLFEEPVLLIEPVPIPPNNIMGDASHLCLGQHRSSFVIIILMGERSTFTQF